MSTITLEHARAVSNLGGVGVAIGAMRALTDDVPFDADELSGLSLIPTKAAYAYLGSLAEDLDFLNIWVSEALDTLLNLHDGLAHE